MHDTPEWQQALEENGWIDAFNTGDDFDDVPGGAGRTRRSTLEGAGAAMSTTDTTRPRTRAPATPSAGHWRSSAWPRCSPSLGAYTIYDATTLEVGFADPVGPRVFPYVIGTVLLVLARPAGRRHLPRRPPESEGGEDVDLTQAPDWATVLKLVGVLVFTIATVNLLGWAITGAILFAGSAWASAAGPWCATSSSASSSRSPAGTPSTSASASR